MTAVDPVRVLVADGSAFFRDTLRDALEADPHIDVMAVAGTSNDEIRLAAARLVPLCGVIDVPSESELRRLGVVEYLIKGVPNAKIVAAIRRAAR